MGEGTRGHAAHPHGARWTHGIARRCAQLARSGLAWIALAGLLGAETAHAAFGLDDVAQRAKDLAAQPWKPPPDRLPPELRDLEYDALRDVRFKPEAAL